MPISSAANRAGNESINLRYEREGPPRVIPVTKVTRLSWRGAREAFCFIILYTAYGDDNAPGRLGRERQSHLRLVHPSPRTLTADASIPQEGWADSTAFVLFRRRLVISQPAGGMCACIRGTSLCLES
ncbi:hypothetical protein Bbelb_172230 [Branchiostoma belcheri]|nr:hypothetical protein Bbelb_172230 [Branchiostoma belcheri]